MGQPSHNGAEPEEKAQGLRWDKLTPDEFENLVLVLVRAMGFVNAQRVGGSNDRGEDIVAYLPASTPGITTPDRKWVFQCKRTRSAPSKADISAELANFEFDQPDTWVLVTPSRPSPELRRWVNGLSKTSNRSYYVQAWWHDDLDRFVRGYHREVAAGVDRRTLERLGLAESAGGTETGDALSRLMAICREFSQQQIGHYARGKYIPNLYVRRDLQDRVSRLFWSEDVLTREMKTSCLRSLAPARARIDGAFDAVSKELRKLEVARDQETDRDKRESLAKELKQFRESFATSCEHAEALTEALAEIETVVSAAPDERFFVGRGTYLEVRARIEAALALLGGAPYFPVSRLSRSAHNTSDWRDLSRVLAVGKADAFVRSALETSLGAIDRVLSPAGVIIDRAGGGKTSLFCSLVDEYCQSHPVVLLFGKETCDGQDWMLNRVLSVLRQVDERLSSLDGVDEFLERTGKFLVVLVDGINENRRTDAFNETLARFLGEARDHRVRVLVSCRDIYWDFFDSALWADKVAFHVRDGLREFSAEEYAFALPLYLAHYRIECTLREAAWRACQHPLLLRFFCEAFGSLDGPVAHLGEVSDIRLKELFDLYLERKGEQIRHSLERRSADVVTRFLIDAVSAMFSKGVTSLPLPELSRATGVGDLDQKSSVYVHLLDEDIILEEAPEGSLKAKKITFVYEEFMEYLLARSLLEDPGRFGLEGPAGVFPLLDRERERWINVTGVGEYVGLMSLYGDHGASRADALSLMENMVASGRKWFSPFWRIVGKCSDEHLGPDLFNLFPRVLDISTVTEEVPEALTSMRRYSESGAHHLAGALLWSAALPFAVGWTEALGLEGMDRAGLDAVARKVTNSRWRDNPPPTVVIPIFDSSERFLSDSTRAMISKARRRFDRTAHDGLLRVIWDAFPHYIPLMLNGLISTDIRVRRLCAMNLRHAPRGKRELAYVCAFIAHLEPAHEIKQVLLATVEHLEQEAAPTLA